MKKSDWTVKQCDNAEPGRHRVSACLYLVVEGRNKRWAFRFTRPGTKRQTEKGLGRYKVVTLAEARAKVHGLRRAVAKGVNPIDAKRAATPATTFAGVAADYIEVQARRYRNPNTVRNTRLMLLTHAAKLGDMPVSAIDTSHVKAALQELWLRAPDQAKRTVAAILRVLKYAKASGLTTASAADIRDSLSQLLPRPNGPARHQLSMPYKNIPTFMCELQAAQTQGEALSPAVIEFLILTAARENEVCRMRFGEIDWQERVWTVPAERMGKTLKPHEVPLSDRALALLERQRGLSNTYVWPGRDGIGCVTGKSVYKYLTVTMGLKGKASIHGFRSTFREYLGDKTDFAREHIEECLSHQVGNAVERAYRRHPGIGKKREIFRAWAAYCESASVAVQPG
jgi:integrase